MRTIKTYSNGVPFYEAHIGSWATMNNLIHAKGHRLCKFASPGVKKGIPV
jgi:hypothetical protein